MARKPTADEAADYLIALAHQRGESITELKLQILLYYAQAWHLALYDSPLFDGKFEAGIYGPRLPSIYCRFKQFGFHEIPALSASPDLPGEAAGFLDEVACRYLSRDEWDLYMSSCEEDPWRRARGGLPMDEPSQAELSETVMRAYFRYLAEAA